MVAAAKRQYQLDANERKHRAEFDAARKEAARK